MNNIDSVNNKKYTTNNEINSMHSVILFLG